MTVLKARVAGAWQTIGAGFGPAGGVAGDLLIKNSAADFDAVWDTSIPKLTLSSVVDVSLSSTTHALTVGDVAAGNLGIYRSGIQARNTGATNILRLNYYGGSVNIGGGDASQYPGSLIISDSIHATSRRVTLQLGSAWSLIQDFVANGDRDFSIYNISGRHGIRISSDAYTVTVNDKLVIGNDARLEDIDVAHTIGVISQTDSTQGRLRLGSQAYIAAQSNLLDLFTANTMFLSADTTLFRSSAYVNFGYCNSAGIGLYGNRSIAFPDWGGGWYMQDTTYIRAVNDKTIYTAGTIQSGYMTTTLLYAPSAGNLIIRLYGQSDANHELKFSSATPTGSGEACNGPRLSGYASVWLHSTSANMNFFLASGGHVHINSGKQYSFLSSIRLKKDVEPMSIQSCLDQVLRWRPVTFKWKENDEYGEGFIAEELDEVSPWHVTRDGPAAVEPGRINGIGYATLSIQLAGAIQVLNNRIEELEKKVA